MRYSPVPSKEMAACEKVVDAFKSKQQNRIEIDRAILQCLKVYADLFCDLNNSFHHSPVAGE
jgi:hypothetical protein